MEWKVTAEESGLKLQNFLKNKLGENFGTRQIKRALEAGQCRVNGKVERFASTLVGRGDSILFDIKPETSLDEPSRLSSFLYTDADIIAYNKPSGIASDDKHLLLAMHNHFKGAILLHRLDRDTTGVLLFARQVQMADEMLTLFKKREVKKSYLALVDGIPKESAGVVENYLGRLNVYQGQTIWGAVSREKGKLARTAWRLKKKGKNCALIECFPETGRTHQIRVHLSSIGHPILGDYQYGRQFQSAYRPGRLLLHAAEISFLHPRNKTLITVAAPLPEDFKEAMKELLKETD